MTVRDPLAGIALDGRLADQLRFCLEIDKVKQVLRRNFLSDASRREGDAEHQWHLAVMALVLAEHAAEPVDTARVAAMLLVHDLVEIDAGDAFLYDPVARDAAAAKEVAAATRIFGLLPGDQGRWLYGLWDEYEHGASPEACFARAVDRLAPILLNAASGGVAWAEHGITADQVSAMAERIELGSPELERVAQAVIAAAVSDGVLCPGPPALPGRVSPAG
ncbi:MAG: HD domain-containing protein [Acidimicrobiales bacterium]